MGSAARRGLGEASLNGKLVRRAACGGEPVTPFIALQCSQYLQRLAALVVARSDDAAASASVLPAGRWAARREVVSVSHTLSEVLEIRIIVMEKSNRVA